MPNFLFLSLVCNKFFSTRFFFLLLFVFVCVCSCVYHGDSIEKLDTMDFPHSYYFQFDVTITRAPNRILYVAAGNISFFSLSHIVIGRCARQRRRKKNRRILIIPTELRCLASSGRNPFAFPFRFCSEKSY